MHVVIFDGATFDDDLRIVLELGVHEDPIRIEGLNGAKELW